MLAEREAELAALHKAVRSLTAGTGSLVLIGGEPGTGRSALLNRLRGMAEDGGALVLRADGAASERGFRFGLARRLLQGLSRAAAPPAAPAPERGAGSEASPPPRGYQPGSTLRSPPGFESALPPAGAEPPPDPSTVPVSVLHALHALLVQRSAEHPVVLAVDDLHFADDASLRCLAYLMARLRGMRVLIAVVQGTDSGRERAALLREITANADHRLRPGALSPAGTEALVRERLGTAPDPEFAVACHELTRGSPRDLGSLLARAAESGLSADSEAVFELQELAEADRRRRLSRALSATDATARVARAVVVLGEHAEPALVQRLSGLDLARYEEALRALQPWFQARPERIAPSSEDRELTDAIVAAVEETVPAAESAQLHLRAAALLHGNGQPPEPVADQLLLVNSALSSWGVQRLREAAVAVQPRSPQTAARYLRRALLDLEPRGAFRARLLAELGSVELAFDTTSAVRHINQAVPRLHDVRDRAGVVARLPLTVTAAAQQVADLVESVGHELGPAEELTFVDKHLALRLEARRRYAALDDPFAHADAEARLRELTDATGQAPTAAERELRVVLLSAVTLSGRGRAADVAAMTRDLLEHEPANACTAPHSMLGFLPSLLLSAGSPEGLESWLALAGDHARRQRARGTEALVLAERSLLELDAGQLVRARDSALAAFELADPQRHESMTLPVFAMGAVARRLRDDRLAEPLLRMPAPESDLRLFATRRLVQCGLAMGDGDLPTALAQVLDCGRRLEQAGWYGPALYPWRSSAALLHQRLGDVRAAGELAEEDHERSRRWGAPAPLGRALRVLAWVTGGSRGIELLREAVQVLRSATDRLELSRALIALGTALAERDPAESGELIAEGRQVAARCGERSPGQPVSAFPEQGPNALEGMTGRLTRAEHSVAELAALGRTNQDIADELRVSRRAVEKHLTAAYRKLGIEGRAELSGALRGGLAIS